MKYRIAIVIFIFLISKLAFGQQNNSACKTKFSLAERDALGNVNTGFSSDGLKWYEKKVAKQYPSVCYEEQKPNVGVWLYISVSTVTQDTATATTNTSPNGDGGSTSHTAVTTGTVNYPVYTLKIGKFSDGKLEVLRTFQRTKANSGNGIVTGLVRSFSNPEHNVIEDAVKWLSASELLTPSP